MGLPFCFVSSLGGYLHHTKKKKKIEIQNTFTWWAGYSLPPAVRQIALQLGLQLKDVLHSSAILYTST